MNRRRTPDSHRRYNGMEIEELRERIRMEHVVPSELRNQLEELEQEQAHWEELFPGPILVPVERLRSGRSARLRPAPGSHLIDFATLLFSKKTRDTVLLSTISDMREEYLDALQDGAKWRARIARVRGYFAFGAAIASNGAAKLVARLVKSWGLSF